MNDRPPPRSTSLPLIVLTLVTGIALGWLLRDTLGSSGARVGTPTVITSQNQGDLLPTAVAATPSDVPATPSDVPTTPSDVPATPSDVPATPSDVPATPSDVPATPSDVPATPSDVPATPSDVPATPPAPEIVAYAGHVVAAGETLETIAADGGSSPELLASYNLLDGAPAPGRALIVPRIAGRAATLESAPVLVQRGPAEQPWVALTLDAGASADPVPRMLQTLRDHHVKITFFLTGQWIKENPDLTRQIVADGHEIANHTFSHPDLTKLDDDSIRAELADTEELLRQTAGVTARPFFRPPFGAYDERVLRIAEGAGYLPVYWTLDSLDSVGEPKTPAFLLDRVTGKLPPDKLRGAIILAHCGSDPTADALPQILDRFAAMGFEVKKLSEVLGG